MILENNIGIIVDITFLIKYYKKSKLVAMPIIAKF
jgi:hypothetical protein